MNSKTTMSFPMVFIQSWRKVEPLHWDGEKESWRGADYKTIGSGGIEGVRRERAGEEKKL